MAVKASAQITISKVIDIYACYRYYKLQSSTLAKPDKPTTNPPSGWSDTEPAYVSGSTNTLYFVDCNVYSDQSFSFSEVSKSSSYEAAKDAWNKANNAQNTVDNLEIGGRNLLRNSGKMLIGTSNYATGTWRLAGTSNSTMTKTHVDITDPPKSCQGVTGAFQAVGSHPPSKADGECIGIDSFPYFDEAVGSDIIMSGWARVVGGGDNCYFGFSGYQLTLSNGKVINNYWCVKLDTTGEWTRVVIHGKTKAKVGAVYCGFITGDDSVTVQACGLKFEKGNLATDWTPAPEDNIAKVDVEYYLSTSATSLAGGSWSTTAPTWVNGKYMWSRTVTVDGAGNKTYSPSQNGVCIAGAKGDIGSTGAAGKGVSSIVEQYYKSTSATALSGGSWSTTYPGWENGKYIWTRSVTTYTDNTTDTTTPICVTGTKGDTGATGKGIKSTAITYQTSASGTTAPTGTWSSTVPATTADKPYLWTRTVITYTDNTTSTSYAVGSTPEGITVGGRNLIRNSAFKSGKNVWVDWGSPATREIVTDNGKTWMHIVSNKQQFQGVQQITPNGSVQKGDTVTFSARVKGGAADQNFTLGIHWRDSSGKILSQTWKNSGFTVGTTETICVWTGTITDNDCNNLNLMLGVNDTTAAYDVYFTDIKLEKGNKATDWTPAPEDSISSVSTEYYLSTSATSLAGGSWSTTAPTWVNGKYMWCRTVIADGSGNKTYSPSSNGVCIAGAKGDTGNQALQPTRNWTGTFTTIGTTATASASKDFNRTPVVGDTFTNLDGSSNTGTWQVTAISGDDVTIKLLSYVKSKGDTGATGKGISSGAVTYQASTSGTSIPTGTWATSIPSVAAGSYLWTRVILTYTDKTSTTSYAVSKMGSTGATGKGIKSTSITYQAHSNGTTAPTGTWTELVPTTSAEKPYLWSRTILTYTDNTTSTTYSVGSTPDGVLDEIKKVLRYDDTKITLGRTGSNITLNLQSTDMVISDGEVDLMSIGLSTEESDGTNWNVATIFSNQILSLSCVNDMRLTSSQILQLKSLEGGITFDVSSYQGSGQPIKFYKGVHFNTGWTQSIPTLDSGNCNSITTSGYYYIGSNGTNRPESTNGWLECMKYSTNYCAQTYTTHTGKRYTRYQQNGTWGAWFRVWQSRQLFGNESVAMNVAITLSDSAANYDMLEIFYKTNDSEQNSTRVYSPNGKKVSLTSTHFVTSNKDMILKSKVVTISGKTIDTLNNSSQGGYITGESAIHSGSSPGNTACDNVGVIRVLGWR